MKEVFRARLLVVEASRACANTPYPYGEVSVRPYDVPDILSGRSKLRLIKNSCDSSNGLPGKLFRNPAQYLF